MTHPINAIPTNEQQKQAFKTWELSTSFSPRFLFQQNIPQTIRKRTTVVQHIVLIIPVFIPRNYRFRSPISSRSYSNLDAMLLNRQTGPSGPPHFSAMLHKGFHMGRASGASCERQYLPESGRGGGAMD